MKKAILATGAATLLTVGTIGIAGASAFASGMNTRESSGTRITLNNVVRNDNQNENHNRSDENVVVKNENENNLERENNINRNRDENENNVNRNRDENENNVNRNRDENEQVNVNRERNDNEFRNEENTINSFRFVTFENVRFSDRDQMNQFEQRCRERVLEAERSGEITEAQANLILAKLNQIIALLVSSQNDDHHHRHLNLQRDRDDWRTWARDNDIPTTVFGHFLDNGHSDNGNVWNLDLQSNN